MSNLVLSCVYGSRHVPFVHTFIFSVLESCPNVKVIIGYSEFPEFERNLLELAYPQVTFTNIELKNRVTSTHAARASKKTYLWYQLFEEYVSLGDNAAFLDIDTIMVQSPFEVFAMKGDLALTRKLGKWPLNTGVIFVKKSPSTLDFFQKWNQKTENIIKSESLNSEAERQSGGADQDSIIKMLKISELISDFSVENTYNEEFDIQIEFLPCNRYNETESVPFNDEVKIIHFKAGWHRILLSRSRYSRNRPAKTSTEFHEIWKSYYSKSKNHLFRAIFEESALSNMLNSRIVKDETTKNEGNYSEFFKIPLLFKNLGVINIYEFRQSDKDRSLGRRNYSGKRKSSKMTMIDPKECIPTDFSNNQIQSPTNAALRLHGNSKVSRVISSTKTSSESNYGVVINKFYSIYSLWLALRLVRVQNPPSIIFVIGMRGNANRRDAPSLVRFLFNTYFDRIFFSDDYPTMQQEVRSDQIPLFWDKTSLIYNELQSENSKIHGSKNRTSCFILPTPRDFYSLNSMFIWPIKTVLIFYKQVISAYFRL